MTRVMAAGVFDLLHTGHLHYLTEARAMGDQLVVVIARDVSVERRKRPPITPEQMRLDLVQALKPVDRAVLGHRDDHFKTVEEVRPDIIALGHDDYHQADEIVAECQRRGLDVQVRRVSKFQGELAGTRRIVARILEHLDAYRAYVERGDGPDPPSAERDGGDA